MRLFVTLLDNKSRRTFAKLVVMIDERRVLRNAESEKESAQVC